MRPAAQRLNVGFCVGVLALLASAPASAGVEGGHGDSAGATLVKFAALPAETFVSASEPSGSLLGATPVNGITLPFVDQPIQGFSGIVPNGDATFDVLSDNGYGAQANSGDFVLRIHRIAPDFATSAIDVVGGINLTDPNHQVPFPLNRADRVLTGADFDPESIIRTADGSYWLGEEFGPFLLHIDRAGRLIQPPVSIPGVYSPENPLRGDTPANLNPSRGLESLARSPDGRTLYPLLEGTVAGDPPGSLRMYEFDVATSSYTGRRWTYQLDNPGHSAPDLITVDANRMLVLERDGAQGDTAAFKRVFLVDRRHQDNTGALVKRPVADLLRLSNPQHIGGFADPFRFPFFTIETLVLLDNHRVGVLNDNNFPFSAGRTPGRPDNNEFIVIRLDPDLRPDPRALH